MIGLSRMSQPQQLQGRFTIYSKYWPQQAKDELVSVLTQKLLASGISTSVTFIELSSPTRTEIVVRRVPGLMQWTHKSIVDGINTQFPGLVNSI